MGERMFAPREITSAFLERLNRELIARGATDFNMEQSEQPRGEYLVYTVTPNKGDKFEMLFPYVRAFPTLLENLPVQGHA